LTTDLLLGIDIGTTKAKVGAFDLEGQLIASSDCGYPLSTVARENAAEQQPQAWWSATVQSLNEICGQIDPARIVALSVGGQGPTLVALSSDLEPVYPALTWMDLRATKEAEFLSEHIGRTLPPHFFMPKAMWFKANRADAYAKTRWFCQSWDYVSARMMDSLVVSYAPGIAPWDKTLIEASEMDPLKFPQPRMMGEVLGELTSSAAKATGLPAGIPIVGGISDFFEGLIGSGAIRPGLALDNGGTSGAFSVCWDKKIEGQGLLTVPSFMDGFWHVGGPVSTSGKALDWWIESVLMQDLDHDSIVEWAAKVPAGSDRLIFLPYLAGERAPIWDPQARGSFFGLSLDHDRAHMTRAILEGVAYTLCHLIELIEIAGGEVLEIRSNGGQSRSEFWSRIKADATGRKVVMPVNSDSPMLGAAIIAGVGIEVFGNFVEGSEKMAKPRAVIEPNEDAHARYQELFAIYRDLYPQIKPLYQKLNQIL
jgi:xylulokinase